MIKSIQSQDTSVKHAVNTLSIHKIKANSPRFNNTKNWRAAVSG